MRINYFQILLILVGVCGGARMVMAVDVCTCNHGQQTCDVGEYCALVNSSNNEYDCTPCPNGTVPNSACNSCITPVVTYCAGYTDPCPTGVESNYKCKKVTGCPNGCQKYELCNSANGNSAGVAISGDGCHLEGDSCYSNTRACKDFDVEVSSGSGDWICRKEYQTGNAYWYPESWDVGGCECNKSGISTDGCADGVVRHSRQDNFISGVTDKITYKQTRRYCEKCVPGKVPIKESAHQSSIWYQPDSAQQNSWGVYKCETVSAPHFAPGCVINWGETNWSIATVGCQMSCGSSLLTITTNGATSDAACVPDELQEYSDDTGTFTLGTDKCQ